MPRKTGPVQELVTKAAERVDGWVNTLTGLGLALRDKTVSGVFQVDTITRQDATDLWRGDDMAAKIVETVPDEMMREGWTLQIKDGAELQAQISKQLVELGTEERLHEALKAERAFGGAAILIGAIDGLHVSQPLDLSRMQSVRFLTLLERDELQPERWYGDPLAPKYGEPMTYRLNPVSVTGTAASMVTGAEVHESRLLVFRGIQTSKYIRSELQGWGDSVLVRCNRVISQFNQTWGSAAVLLADFAQAVLKIKDLASFLAANDADSVVNRARAMDLARSVCRAIIIDSEEEFERKVTPLTGMPEMLQQFALRLAAAAKMPISLMIGQAPAGLNATGASDIRFFYDQVAAARSKKVAPHLERLLRILFAAKQGPAQGREPATWSLSFPPLWQETEKEQAETRELQSRADGLYIDKGVLTPEEIAVSRFGGGDGWSGQTQIDLTLRQELAKAPAVSPPSPQPPQEQPSAPDPAPASPAR